MNHIIHKKKKKIYFDYLISASPWSPAGDRTDRRSDTDMDDKDLTSQDLDKLFKVSKYFT